MNSLADMIGKVDLYSAAVLVTMFFAMGACCFALIVKRRSRLEINNDFELAKMRMQADASETRFRSETDRAVKVKSLEQNLITSHRRDED